MKICYIYGDKPNELNCSIWRMWIPGQALIRQGHEVSIIPVDMFRMNTEQAQALCSQADVLVIERVFFGDVLTALMFWKVRNKVIIGNFDDAYDLIEKTNPSYAYWTHGGIDYEENGEKKHADLRPRPIKQFEWGLKAVHGVTLPSKVLMNDWKKLSPSYYVPNYPEINKYIGFEKPQRDYLTIGWGGSLSHFESFRQSGVLDGLKSVISQRDNVKVMIVGDKRVFDQIDIPEDKKVFHQYVPFNPWEENMKDISGAALPEYSQHWGKLLAESFDIGLAPLWGPYDQRRSWIKPLEFMLTKIPWLASESKSYTDIAKYGHLVKNSPKAWESSLLRMIDNYSEEKSRAEKDPFEFAIKQDINLNTEYILETYIKIARLHAEIDLKG